MAVRAVEHCAGSAVSRQRRCRSVARRARVREEEHHVGCDVAIAFGGRSAAPATITCAFSTLATEWMDHRDLRTLGRTRRAPRADRRIEDRRRKKRDAGAAFSMRGAGSPPPPRASAWLRPPVAIANDLEAAGAGPSGAFGTPLAEAPVEALERAVVGRSAAPAASAVRGRRCAPTPARSHAAAVITKRRRAGRCANARGSSKGRRARPGAGCPRPRNISAVRLRVACGH